MLNSSYTGIYIIYISASLLQTCRLYIIHVVRWNCSIIRCILTCMYVCVRNVERRCLNKIFTEHWQHPCCQVTSCNPLHDDALPWCQRTDRCGPHTSGHAIHPGGKIIIRSNFENGISGIVQNDPGEIPAVTFGDVVPQKGVVMHYWRLQKSGHGRARNVFLVFALRPASFPNTTELQFVSMAFKIRIGEIQENSRGLFLEHFKWFRVLTTKSKLTNVMPRLCTMHPA